jgi:hypothetical protein
MLAVGKGVARSMYCDQKSYGDFVPVDIAINALFISVWNFYTYKYERNYLMPLILMLNISGTKITL